MNRILITTKLILFIILAGTTLLSNAQISINTTGSTANASAMLDVSSTEKGILIPRMTSAQRAAIINPSDGLLVFDTSTNSFWYYSGDASNWQKVGNSVAGATELNELSDTKYDGSSLFIGNGSGINDDQTTNENVAVGKNSLHNNTTGHRNSTIGFFSQWENTTGSNNTTNGFQALYFNTTGNNNTAIGMAALKSSLTGNENTAIGKVALYNNTTGSFNTSSGSFSLYNNTTASYNTASGYYSLYHNTTGNYNTANGYYSLSSNITGHFNTAIGSKALQNNTAGDNTCRWL